MRVFVFSILAFCLSASPAAARSVSDEAPDGPSPDVAAVVNAPVQLLRAGHGDVLRLYWAFFNREPDAPGAAYWKALFDEGVSIERMAEAFATSDEFKAKYAGISTDRLFVERVYNNTLRRRPDPIGWDYWTDLIESGRITRNDTVLFFAKSFEFVTTHPYGNRANLSAGPAVFGMDLLEAVLTDRPQPRIPTNPSEDFRRPLGWVRALFGSQSTIEFIDACQAFDSGAVRCTYRLTSPDADIGSRIVEVTTKDNQISSASWPRVIVEQRFKQYASVGPVALHLPSSKVERIGFHESGHDGSQQAAVVETEVPTQTLKSRKRGTGSRTAADIAVQPGAEIRSPVTGTVLRAGTYTLYCKHKDHYLVVEPDARPGWEVKMLHFEGLKVKAGDRLVAGQTPVGTSARKLALESQIDKFNASPSNPHIHIEVVDPSIPDRPSGGGC